MAICGLVNPAETSLSTSCSRSRQTRRMLGRRGRLLDASRRHPNAEPAELSGDPTRHRRRAEPPERGERDAQRRHVAGLGEHVRRFVGAAHLSESDARAHVVSGDPRGEGLGRFRRHDPDSRPARCSHTPISPTAMPWRHARPARAPPRESERAAPTRRPASRPRRVPPRSATAVAGVRSRGRCRAPRRAAGTRRRRRGGQRNQPSVFSPTKRAIATVREPEIASRATLSASSHCPRSKRHRASHAT